MFHRRKQLIDFIIIKKYDIYIINLHLYLTIFLDVFLKILFKSVKDAAYDGGSSFANTPPARLLATE